MTNKSDTIYSDLKKSIEFLSDTLSQPYTDYIRTAAIQCFEISFELSWKYLQAKLRENGLDAASPRATFREAGKAGYIDNVEAWLDFVDQRNLTTHTYRRQLADEVYHTIVTDFLPASQKLISTPQA